jgi:hypothetical protein
MYAHVPHLYASLAQMIDEPQFQLQCTVIHSYYGSLLHPGNLAFIPPYDGVL